jgi:hypothetical protein
MAFEKLISDPKGIPSNSVIILSQDQHHVERRKRKAEVSFIVKEKRRKVAATSKGQKSITDYFRSVKSTSNTTQKPEEPTYKLEEIIKEKRGTDCNIKILWLPKRNDELNPSNYVSVVFNKDVVTMLENDESKDALESCKDVLDMFPSAGWWTIMQYIEKLENAYEREFKESNESSDEENSHNNSEVENEEPNNTDDETN